MKARKPIARLDSRTRLGRPEGRSELDRFAIAGEESEGWLAFIASITIGLGIAFAFLCAPLVIVASSGGVGDCFDEACFQEQRFWSQLASSQAIVLYGWPVAALVLGLAARTRPRLWLAFVALTGAILFAGWAVFTAGFANPTPSLFGRAIPVLAPGFAIWMPATFFFVIGGAMWWTNGLFRPPNARLSRTRPTEQP